MNVQRDDSEGTKMSFPIPERPKLKKIIIIIHKLRTAQYLDKLLIQGRVQAHCMAPNKIQVWVREHGFQTLVLDAITIYCISIYEFNILPFV